MGSPAPKILFPEKLKKANIAFAMKQFSSIKKNYSHSNIEFDFSKTNFIDSAGVALIIYLKKQYKNKNVHVDMTGMNEHVREIFDLYQTSDTVLSASIKKDDNKSIFEATGDSAFGFLNGITNFLVLFVDTFYFLPTTLIKKTKKRIPLIIEEMARIGSSSAGIILFLSFLVGLTLAMQSAIQLKQFGADIFLANLTGAAFMKEMGPLLTAILLAGRIGSSTAAEIATRQITEEIDALKTMGLNPVEYIVVPKFVAISITGPMLTLLSILIGIIGGYLIGVFYLDLSSSMFITQLLKSLYLADYIQAIIKSLTFSWAIIFIGAYKGFSVRGGPLEVGNATTSSVVASIFAVIVLDSIFSFIFYL